MSPKTEIKQKVLHFYEFSDSQPFETKNEMTVFSKYYSSKRLKLSIETLTEDIKPLSTKTKLESRDESIIATFLGFLGLPGL